MASPTQKSPEHTPEAPVRRQEVSWRRPELLVVFTFFGLFFLLFAGLAARTYARPLLNQIRSSQQQQPTPTLTPIPGPLTPLQPNSVAGQRVALPVHRSLLYEATKGIYSLPIKNLQTSNPANPAPTPTPPKAVLLNTPGYKYNHAVPSLLTPSGQLIYSGIGIWLADVQHGSAKQIANWPTELTITSLVLSQDGSTIAWSTAPLNGHGTIDIYLQRLDAAPQLIYQQSSEHCPCFRVFSLPGNQQSHPALLLTDDYGDHSLAQFGLWALDTSQSRPRPVQLLDTQLQKGPLALSPQGNALLYAGNEMLIPMPDDKTIPVDVATQSYANSLYLTQVDLAGKKVSPAQEILPSQRQQSNVGIYRWVTTPTFSPDGQTLVYVVFSSQMDAPYSRHNSIYTVHIHTDSGNVKVDKPQLLTPAANTHLLELGVWLDENTVTFCSDGNFYALDVRSGAAAYLGSTRVYAHIIGVR